MSLRLRQNSTFPVEAVYICCIRFAYFFSGKMLHIANTFFEWELQKNQKCSLFEGFHQHPIFRQMQFLPALYGDQGEGCLISDLPEESYWATLKQRGLFPPKPFLLPDSSPFTEIESWGASRWIAEFAAKHNLTYHMPNWEVVRKVN